MISLTHLVVLGALRQFQPVHGYLIRRELASWHADQWANLNPGSVYNAIRKLEAEGLVDEVGTGSVKGRPARTAYQLTAAGDRVFREELREAISGFLPYEPARLYAGACFMAVLSRAEVIEALQRREAEIARYRGTVEHEAAAFIEDPSLPDHVAEAIRLRDARTIGELGWLRAFLTRLELGEYEFAGEGRRAPARSVGRASLLTQS